MKTPLSVVGAVVLSATTAFAQSPYDLETSQEAPPETDEAPAGAADEQPPPVPQPTTPAPTEAPPPTGAPPSPPDVQGQYTPPPSNSATPQGQWVYTQQYGWVYAPYDQSYTYVDPNVSSAQMYIYRPSIGWGWSISPWVINIGPRPYWGAWGVGHYAWYSHPWFRPRVVVGQRGIYHYGGGWGGHTVYAPRRYAPAPAHAFPRGPIGPRGGGGGWGGGGRGGGGGHHR